jgi:uncharacterized protein (DUF2336 family)
MDETFIKKVAALEATGEAQRLVFDSVVARVLVDQFCAIPAPSNAETTRFTSAILRALDKTDAATAARIAAPLASRPHTPPQVLARLTEMGIKAAVAVLTNAPNLPADQVSRRAEIGASEEAVVIAQRHDLDRQTIEVLCRRPDAETLRALVANPRAQIDRAALALLTKRGRVDQVIARGLLARGQSAGAALALFMSADAEQRLRMMAHAQRETLGSPGATLSPLQAIRPEALGAATSGDTRAFAASVARQLHIGREAIDRMIHDDRGEPLGLLFAAMGASAQAGARALLAVRPSLGGAMAATNSRLRLALDLNPAAAFRIVAAVADVPISGPRRVREYAEAHSEPIAPIVARLQRTSGRDRKISRG